MRIAWRTSLGSAIVVGGIAAALAGCGGAAAASGAPGPDAARDTVRGTVRVVGADPITQVVLHTDRGRLAVAGPAAPVLRRVNGLEVRVDGRVHGDTLTATAFRVRALDGMPAVDGTLELDGDTVVLTTPAGRSVRWTPAPETLRVRAGAHVWIAGPPGGAPQAWGVIGSADPRGGL